MAFTYNLSSSDAAVVRIAQVRMRIRDTVESSGVLPASANLPDAEITQLLTDNDNDILASSAAACELIAAAWANAADITVGPRRENLSQVADRWQKLAEQLRGQASRGAGIRIRRMQQPDNYDVTEYQA
jgi:hypothetical protein